MITLFFSVLEFKKNAEMYFIKSYCFRLHELKMKNNLRV